MRRVLFFTIILVFFGLTASAQRSTYFKRVFVDAEYFLLYEEYKDALPLYLEIHNAFPDNANICYRIGQCYLNIPNEKHKSIPFFELAIKNITNLYREGYYTESQAPKEAFLYYGKALRIIGEFDKSIQAFTTYLSMLGENNAKEKELTRIEIHSVEYAKELKDNPITIKFSSTGRNINTRFAEINPAVSLNNNVLVYTSIQQFYNAIMISYRENNEWKHPVNLNAQLFADGPITTVGISSDGKSILLSRNDNDVFNLYISHFDTVKNTWSVITKLPKEINSKSWENCASFSPTGDTIFFSSNRTSSKGGFDLFMSVKTSSGWSEAKTLGDQLNTGLDEIAPFMSHDGKKLFFASNGHPTMGGYDIFVSYKREGKWTKPINLGYPLNTPDDDTYFFPLGDGLSGYISRLLPQSYGDNDIYLVEFEPKKQNGKGSDGIEMISVPITQGQMGYQINSRNGVSGKIVEP